MKMESFKYFSSEECLEAVRQKGDALQYVQNQTEEICLEAVRQNSYALQWVQNQTEEICIEAVRKNGCALRYVNIDAITPSAVEMTLEQVCKELGKNIKIIKEK